MPKNIDTTLKQKVEVDLDIIKPFYSASKTFKNKGWPNKEPGYGFSVSKLDSLVAKGADFVTIRLDRRDIFEVELAKLRTKIEQLGCFNTNGHKTCGYITKSDIYSLARSLKSGLENKEATKRAEG